MNVRAIAGPGRGRKMTVRGKVMDCAESVLMWHKSMKDHEFGVQSFLSTCRYSMAYFGKAMREHLKVLSVTGEDLSSQAKDLVDRAEKVLQTECDGKDCSLRAP